MRLFEAIIDAKHRALGGDAEAGLRPADYAEALPVAALTCIDSRLNPLFPEVLGLPKEHFIWLRNAGNIITGPLSGTMRSLALACAVKGAREIAIIGHTDCQVCKTSAMSLTDAFRALGVERQALPENLTEFFGLFASERQNVIKAADFVRHSPLIGPKVPVHGLVVDSNTGKLEWVVNGYQTLETATAPPMPAMAALGGQVMDTFKALEDFKIGEMKFPEGKIGEAATQAENWFYQRVGQLGGESPEPAEPPQPVTVPPPPVIRRVPMPPPIRPAPVIRRWKK